VTRSSIELIRLTSGTLEDLSRCQNLSIRRTPTPVALAPAVIIDAGTDSGDHPLGDEHIGVTIEIRHRVDDPAAAKKSLHASSPQ
jgi:hypothetical protein